jgi:hypothetical protein
MSHVAFCMLRVGCCVSDVACLNVRVLHFRCFVFPFHRIAFASQVVKKTKTGRFAGAYDIQYDDTAAEKRVAASRIRCVGSLSCLLARSLARSLARVFVRIGTRFSCYAVHIKYCNTIRARCVIVRAWLRHEGMAECWRVYAHRCMPMSLLCFLLLVM